MTNWDVRWLDLASYISSWSKDPSTKVGCVVVGADREIRATGYNGFPRGTSDGKELYADREVKHLRVVHAEANAVAAAARVGVSLKGTTAYVTHPCCAQCAALLIQAGVSRVVIPGAAELRPEWKKSALAGVILFAEAGVEWSLASET